MALGMRMLGNVCAGFGDVVSAVIRHLSSALDVCVQAYVHYPPLIDDHHIDVLLVSPRGLMTQRT